MIYTLQELLSKMGAPEVREKNRMQWHYFDKSSRELAGFAEIKMIERGRYLIAELQHMRHNYEDDLGQRHTQYTETFYMHAEKIGERYQVTKIAFDGEEYKMPQKALVELGLSIFHSRALDISILMIEQSFNKQDILSPIVDEKSQFKNVPVQFKWASKKKQTWGVVVPFRPRNATAISARR